MKSVWPMTNRKKLVPTPFIIQNIGETPLPFEMSIPMTLVTMPCTLTIPPQPLWFELPYLPHQTTYLE